MLYSAIHKATTSLVTGRSLHNGKMSMGNRRTERSPKAVLYGARQSGGFVNSAVNSLTCAGTDMASCFPVICSVPLPSPQLPAED